MADSVSLFTAMKGLEVFNMMYISKPHVPLVDWGSSSMYFTRGLLSFRQLNQSSHEVPALQEGSWWGTVRDTFVS